MKKYCTYKKTSWKQSIIKVFSYYLTETSMPTAIVTGATGILGREIVATLGKDARWAKIHALSRSQKDEYPPSVQHDHIDLTGSAQDLAKQLQSQGVEGEYLFFAAYLAKPDEKEASDVNGKRFFDLANLHEPSLMF